MSPIKNFEKLIFFRLLSCICKFAFTKLTRLTKTDKTDKMDGKAVLKIMTTSAEDVAAYLHSCKDREVYIRALERKLQRKKEQIRRLKDAQQATPTKKEQAEEIWNAGMEDALDTMRNSMKRNDPKNPCPECKNNPICDCDNRM